MAKRKGAKKSTVSPARAANIKARRMRFAQEYVIDRNATKAAARAGYSARSARHQGSQALKDPAVQAFIDAHDKKIADKFEVTAERVVAEFARLAFSDIRSVFGPAGEMLLPQELPEHAARAIAGIDVTKRRVPREDGEGFEVEEVVKFKLHDKIGALNALAKHTGVLKEPAAAPGGASWQLDPAKLATMSDAEVDAAIAIARKLTGA